MINKMKLEITTNKKDVHAIKIKDIYYPINKNDTEIFIYGEGNKKIKKSWLKTMIKIDNLSENFTSEDLKKVYNEYGFNVVLKLICCCGVNLYSDQSICLDNIKAEIRNSIRYGKNYDIYKNYIKKIGSEFLTALKDNAYYTIGNCLYYDIDLIGFIDRMKIHPEEFINHKICFFITKPSFDVIGFDNLLNKLMSYKEGKDERGYPKHDLRDKIVSVQDRINYFCNGLSEKFEKIFELESKLFYKEDIIDC